MNFFLYRHANSISEEDGNIIVCKKVQERFAHVTAQQSNCVCVFVCVMSGKFLVFELLCVCVCGCVCVLTCVIM